MRGQGRQSAIPTPPPRSPTPMKDVGELGGGSGSPIGLPNLESTGNFESEVSGRFRGTFIPRRSVDPYP
ncbi:hypothetical protein CRG98_002793 [Punica granatum]|uniref:Uncharacterized protein n=1 Tax=Punica granatum TaxID=22663 RepID=A0A2I0L7X7_PUNGR|nr:hypothetical protein CRG98_002793 [Punica granatum]